MTLQLIIIADDLTGALDSAAPFTKARVAVARGVDHFDAALRSGADVVAVSTNSRELRAEDAAQQMQRLAQVLTDLAPSRIFKKIDSRLKGHVSLEVKAVTRMTGARSVVVCPAIPDMGRIVRDGCLTGAGVAEPIDVQGVVRPFASASLVCPDASTQAQLDALVSEHSGALLVGARGLAAALARHMKLAGPAPKIEPCGPLLFAIGSRDPVTADQIDALALPVIDAPDGNVGASAPGSCVVRMTGAGTDPAAGLRFAEGVAALAARLKPRAMLCCGGETANAVLAQMGIGQISLRGEPFAGVPLADVVMPWGQVRLLTKSGGFGASDLLVKLTQAIEPERPSDYERKQAQVVKEGP